MDFVFALKWQEKAYTQQLRCVRGNQGISLVHGRTSLTVMGYENTPGGFSTSGELRHSNLDRRISITRTPLSEVLFHDNNENAVHNITDRGSSKKKCNLHHVVMRIALP